jgi:hypothetical protein
MLLRLCSSGPPIARSSIRSQQVWNGQQSAKMCHGSFVTKWKTKIHKDQAKSGEFFSIIGIRFSGRKWKKKYNIGNGETEVISLC